MDTRSEQDNLFRWYLLGATSPEEDEQIEQRLRNQDINDELLLAEEELIDDYARGELALYERELFEENFLTTPERLKNLLMAQAAVRYAATQTVRTPEELTDLPSKAVEERGAERVPDPPRPVAVGRDGRQPDWWRALFEHGWNIATYAALVLVVGLVGMISPWSREWLLGESEVARGLSTLNNAFREQRPTEARITGFGYAVSNVTRGGRADNQKDVAHYRRLDEAEFLLLRAARDNENAETLHALGKFYLAKREFDKAIEQFDKALTYDQNDAPAHSDFGAALVEKLKHSGNQNKEAPEVVDKAFSHINRALELDGNLLEALFNRALLYQLQKRYVFAREAWKKYLEKDNSSKWADEANSYLKELQLKSSSSGEGRYEGLYRDFLQAKSEQTTLGQLIHHGFSRMLRIKTDCLRRFVASVKIRGHFCSNLACFDLGKPIKTSFTEYVAPYSFTTAIKNDLEGGQTVVPVRRLKRPEEVSVDLFTSTVRSLTGKNQDVFAFSKGFSRDRQHGKCPIFAEDDFIDIHEEDFPPFSGLESYSIARMLPTLQFHQETYFSI
jgi:tetratricopeptide (TPR) repeat protein